MQPCLDGGGFQSQTIGQLASAPVLGILQDEQVGIARRQAEQCPLDQAPPLVVEQPAQWRGRRILLPSRPAGRA